MKSKINDYLLQSSDCNSKKLFEYLGKHYQKQGLFKLLDKLKSYEEKVGFLLFDYKNHYKHSANVFLLGLVLYSKLDKLRKNLERFPKFSKLSSEEKRNKFLLRWCIAACLHDVAYPIEMSIISFKQLIDKYAKRKEPIIPLRLNFHTIVPLNIIPKLPSLDGFCLQEDYVKDTALKLIANSLTNTQGRPSIPSILTCDTMHEVLFEYVKECFERGIVDHGLFGALIILKEAYIMYKNNNWNPRGFYYHIVEAATAIFLHNTYEHLFVKESFYGYGKLKLKYPCSLGYLLILCDHIADWDKVLPKPEDEKINKLLIQENFSLHIEKDKIVLNVPHYVYEKGKYKGKTYANRFGKKLNNIFDMRELKIEVSDVGSSDA
ncbi:hypothetical protein KAX02_04740 [candidate division WOR-3 bacterium]|nr:hypothetical protein [candidate division WOR-3 bacterium]